MTPSQQNTTSNARTARSGGTAAQAAETAQTRQLLDVLGLIGEGERVAVAEQVRGIRRSHGKPVARWATPCLRLALHAAVVVRGWPPDQAVRALLAVAADPDTRSTMRLAEAGPWWDEPPVTAANSATQADDLAALEARLDAVDGLRIHLQRQARAELAAEGLAVTRSTVLARPCQIMNRPQSEPGPAPEENSWVARSPTPSPQPSQTHLNRPTKPCRTSPTG